MLGDRLALLDCQYLLIFAVAETRAWQVYQIAQHVDMGQCSLASS